MEIKHEIFKLLVIMLLTCNKAIVFGTMKSCNYEYAGHTKLSYCNISMSSRKPQVPCAPAARQHRR